MELILVCKLFSEPINIVNLVLALFAGIIAVGYFLRPRLFYCLSLTETKCRVKVINKNLLFTVKDIDCEIALSDSKEFHKSNTLDLKKSNTLMLRRFCKSNKDYVFFNSSDITIYRNENNGVIQIKDNSLNKTYSFVRIRLLAPNFLGVKKHYERVYAVTVLEIQEDETNNCAPISQCKHNRLQKN